MSASDASAQTGAPSSTTWKRQRSFRTGSSATIQTLPPTTLNNDLCGPISVESSPQQSTHPPASSEGAPLQRNSSFQSYGTLPTRRRIFNRPSLSFISGRRSLPFSNPTTPLDSSSSFRDYRYSTLGGQRPISTYDQLLQSKDDSEPAIDAKINGIRVWYSSFSSIDWLHDAIKDSVRFSRLRRRKSFRARFRLAFDKSLGWFVVTIVGFLTAIVAFFVVRTEQWLFDLKEGYCSYAWWKAYRFCCPQLEEESSSILTDADTCPGWATWSQVFSQPIDSYGEKVVDYMSYAVIALTLALMSCLLTIYLTKSTTFVTRKESGVRGSEFSDPNNKVPASPDSGPKRKVMYYAAGSGIPEIKTILSGFVIHGYLGGRTLFTKSVGLALSVASGLSLGKEGPFVHIASCIGNIVSRITNKYETNEAKRREILSAACAAGVAVAFGAPIGGTLFSLEEVSYFFPPKVMWRSFFCAMIAAITLKMLDPFGTGKLVLFQVTYDKDWHGYELLPFIFLGLLGGVYGAYFSKLNYWWSKRVRNGTWVKSNPVAEVLLITLVTTLLGFLNPYTRMGGTELVYNLFSECRTGSRNTHSGLCIIDAGSFTHAWPVIRAISVALLVKAALTIITFGIKLPAGIFIPSLGVGACAGRIVGITMQWLQMRNPDAILFKSCGNNADCIIPGLYAMVGAAASLSGVTRTTVSLAVIMFELTDTLTYAVPVMLSVLVAKTVADALEPKGIYDLVIELNQLPYLDAKHEYVWGNVQINDVVSRDVDVIQLDHKNTVQSLRDQLISISSNGNDDNGFPILRRDTDDEGRRMVGYIGANELEHALSIVADSAEEEVHFHTTYSHDIAASSLSSLMESAHLPNSDPFDFSVYMDEAPLTVQNNSPMEMVHQFFVKLGARYVVITDTDGLYEGVIDKKTWLAFLSGLEEK